MEKAGEFLPVTIEGEKGKYFIYNVTNCKVSIDETKSIFEYRTDLPGDSPGLVTPAFHPSGFGKLSIFKLPRPPALTAFTVHCWERTGNPRDNEFKALVEHHKLTGLRFDFAWSEQQGPVPWKNPPRIPELAWKWGDGKKINLAKFRKFLEKVRSDGTKLAK